MHPVGPRIDLPVVVGVEFGDLLDRDDMGHPAGEHDHRSEHAQHHADGQVVGGQGGDDGHGHDNGFAHRHELQGAWMHGVPVDRADRDHDHDRDQCGHGDHADNIAQGQDEDEQEDTREQGG